MDKMQEIERELKLVFRDKSDVPDTDKFISVALKILRSIDSKASLRLDSIAKTESVYWDTKGFQLAKEGLALRVRTVDGQSVVTVKTQTSDEAGADRMLRQRDEFHRSASGIIGGVAPDPGVFRDTPVGARLLAACGSEQLRAVFTTDLLRRTFNAKFPDGSRMAMMLDIGKLLAGKSSEPVRELEIELRAGPPERLYEVAIALVKKLRLGWSGAGKFHRGILLAGGPVLDPPRVALPTVSPDQPIADAMEAASKESMGRAIASCMRFDRDPGDPEAIHDFRIDLRHVRSVLDFSHPLLKEETYKKLRAALGTLFKPTSCLREADMLMESWRLFCDDSGRQFLQGDDGRLVKKLCRHRDSCLDQVLKARLRTRWSRSLLVLAAWTSSPQFLGDAKSARNYASGRLARMEQDIFEHARPESLTRSQDYHALRIQVKRLRMLQAIFRPADASDPPRWDADTLKRFQDALGDFNDAHVNLGIAESLIGGEKQAAEFLSWLSARQDCLQAKCVQLLDACVRT